jgi:hypothetical protein
MRRCEIDDIHIFLQVIRERKDPLAILREAISNSYDAEARNVWVTMRDSEKGKVDLCIDDDGHGIEESRFRDFFGLAITSKNNSKQIGNKGLGTKLFFASDRIEVYTRTSKGERIAACMNEPLDSLLRNRLPEYEIMDLAERLRYRKGTRIVVKGVRSNLGSERLSIDNIELYLRWYTAAGSCRSLFGGKADAFRVTIEKRLSLDKSETRVVSGHMLPGDEDGDESSYRYFAYRFDPFSFRLLSDDGRELGDLEVAGSVVGPDAHIAKDRRVKKKYKGVFLGRDYFIVRDLNREVGGGTGEWQNMHIVANCQQLDLNMSREDFLESPQNPVLTECVNALRDFSNSLIRGSRFSYRGRTVETGTRYAGEGYMRFREKRRVETESQLVDMNISGLSSLSSSARLRAKIPGAPYFEPISQEMTLMLFQAMMSTNSMMKAKDHMPQSMSKMRILGCIGQPRYQLVIQKKTSKGWDEPALYSVQWKLSPGQWNRLKNDHVSGVICWDLEKSLAKDFEMKTAVSPTAPVIPYGESESKNLIILKNLTRAL